MRALVALLALAVAAAVSGQDLSGFERVLLPLDPTVVVVGANNILYRTDFRIYALESRRLFPDEKGQIATVIPNEVSPSSTFDAFRLEPVPSGGALNAAGRLLSVEPSVEDAGSRSGCTSTRGTARTGRSSACQSYASATSARAPPSSRSSTSNMIPFRPT